VEEKEERGEEGAEEGAGGGAAGKTIVKERKGVHRGIGVTVRGIHKERSFQDKRKTKR